MWEFIITIILINVMVLGITYYIYFKYDIYTPLAMGLLIFMISSTLVIEKIDTKTEKVFFENECLVCDKIVYSEEKESTVICDECKEFIKEFKEREE